MIGLGIWLSLNKERGEGARGSSRWKHISEGIRSAPVASGPLYAGFSGLVHLIFTAILAARSTIISILQMKKLRPREVE